MKDLVIELGIAVITTMLVGHVEVEDTREFKSLMDCQVWKYNADMTYKGREVIWQDIKCVKMTITFKEMPHGS